jgi:hypothetical protein
MAADKARGVEISKLLHCPEYAASIIPKVSCLKELKKNDVYIGDVEVFWIWLADDSALPAMCAAKGIILDEGEAKDKVSVVNAIVRHYCPNNPCLPPRTHLLGAHVGGEEGNYNEFESQITLPDAFIDSNSEGQDNLRQVSVQYRALSQLAFTLQRWQSHINAIHFYVGRRGPACCSARWIPVRSYSFRLREQYHLR